MPTRDRPELLGRALRSVLDQRCDSWECIVVDDRSAVPPTLPDDPRFRLVASTATPGPAGTRNAGVACATGDALAFLDDDDRFLPARLDLALVGLERAPIALCWSFFEDEVTTRRGRVLNGDVRDVIFDAATPHIDGTAVRRDVWQPLDETFKASAEVEWWLRMVHEHEVTTVEEVGAVLGRHSGQRVLHGPSERIASSMRLLEEHADYFRTHPAATAYRWRRVSAIAAKTGDRRLARRAAWRSFRAVPSAATGRSIVAALTASVRSAPRG